MEHGRIKLVILALLSAGGLFFSSWTLHHHIALKIGAIGGPSFCNINAVFNCDAVARSEWSTLFGIPLGSYGIAFYLILLLFILARLLISIPENVRFVTTLIFVSSVASVISLSLFVVSEVVVGSLCLLCCALYLINFALFITACTMKGRGKLIDAIYQGGINIIKLPLLAAGLLPGAKASLPAAAGFLIFLGVALMAPAAENIFYINFFAESQEKKVNDQLAQAIAPWKNSKAIKFNFNEVGSERDYSRGPVGAPIEIVEFSDFECPACQRFYKVAESLREKYGDKMRLVHKNYPLDQSCNPAMPMPMHKFACRAAIFARCAGEQDKFWQAADFLFIANPFKEGPENFERRLETAISDLELDSQAIKECMSSDRARSKVQSDIAEGNKLHLQGTPSVWINGKFAPVLTLPVLSGIFDELLEQQKN